MIPIDIIPYERDEKAMKMYKFMTWFIRLHRKEIQGNTEKALRHLLLYGDKNWEEYYPKENP